MMVQLPNPPHEMTWEEIRSFVIHTNAAAMRHLTEWKQVYRGVLRDRLRARLPVPQNVADAYYRERW